jgi:15-cis-phytoene synthase
MSPARQMLDATYRARAIPLGSARYWSWLFAASEARPALLGIFALLAEWNALMDPATDPNAARIKLAWWQDELRRLIAGTPAHPIGAYLLSLPRAGEVDLAPLTVTIEAVIAESNGTPLERSTDLAPHACALRAAPLQIASRLAMRELDEHGLQQCTRELAVGEFLMRSTRDYRREARRGRVPFAVDELLAAGIDTADLCADRPSAQLGQYLQRLRGRAADSYAAALQSLPAACRAPLRHLLVLAALGLKHLKLDSSALESARVQDMLLAWITARRAHG